MNKETVLKYRSYYAKHIYAADFQRLNDDPGPMPEELKKIIDTDRRLMPQHIGFDMAKELFVGCAGSVCDDFVVDDSNSNVVDLLIQYATIDPKFIKTKHDSFDKGILLRGSVGTGKTVLLKAFEKFMQIFSIDNADQYNLPFETSYNIAERYSIKGMQLFDEMPRLKSRPGIIDDIGTEPIVKHFGNEANIIAEIFYRRYDKKVKTFASTNLSAQALKEKYGARIYSRMKQMFNDVLLNGSDRRS